MTLVVTNSAMGTFQACPRLYRYKYIDLAEPLMRPASLTLGTLVHAGLERMWLGHEWGDALEHMYSVADGDVDPYVMARAEAMVLGYYARWEGQDLQTVSVEQEFAVELKSRPGVVLAGKIDAVARDKHGRLWVVEHKTSAEDLSTGSQYWQALHLNLQVSIYLMVAERRLFKEPVEGVIYDVLKKPSIKPLKASKNIKLKKDGTPRAGQREHDEDPNDFRDRLVEALCAAPGAYYFRHAVVRHDREEGAALRDVLDTIDMISESCVNNRWPRAPGACRRFHRLCEFHKVCTGQASIDNRALFRRKEKAHSELEGNQ